MQDASSSNPPAPNAQAFLTYLFSTEKHREKRNRVINYNVVKERDFEVDNLEGYDDFVVVLERSGWSRLNCVIQETNQSIGLDYYANVAHRQFKDYTSYVRGKSIDLVSLELIIFFIYNLLLGVKFKI